MIGRKVEWHSFPKDTKDAASYLEDARTQNRQVSLLSKSMPSLDQTKAYEITAAVCALRQKRCNDIVVGRKIGFTNKSIWPEYNIDASNWSYMYESSVVDLGETQNVQTPASVVTVDLSDIFNLEPKIEPEIVFGLSRRISASMSDAELLNSIEWIAHGFEIVASVFPGWKFTAADTTAAFALHNRLLIGSKIPVAKLGAEGHDALLQKLANFTIDLYQDGHKVDSGKGSNVLGSPIKALRHLAKLLESDEVNMPLGEHEIITTGTLTRALSIGHGDTWSTTIDGVQLPGLNVRFSLE